MLPVLAKAPRPRARRKIPPPFDTSVGNVRLIAELENALEERATKGLRRERRVVESAQGVRLRVEGREILHFGSNDYLGLAGDPRVVAAAQTGAARHGVGSGASHLISGHSTPHDTIERELAAWVAPCNNARALLFSSGYLANLAIVTALVGRGDAVFADKLNHACLNDAALLSRADFVRYAHGDLKALAERLASSDARRKLIATDAVFSMDGDIAALGNLLELAEKYDALLAVDDAHGFGVLGEALAAGRGNSGRGTLAKLGLASERIVYMATLGKAAGVAGAFVAAHHAVVETLIQTARSYIFTTAAPPMLSRRARSAGAFVRAHRPLARSGHRAPVDDAAIGDRDPATDTRRERGIAAHQRCIVEARHLGAGDPPADGATAQRTFAHYVLRLAQCRRP
jgi:8-amino-7-oxononanoate synthase